MDRRISPRIFPTLLTALLVVSTTSQALFAQADDPATTVQVSSKRLSSAEDDGSVVYRVNVGGRWISGTPRWRRDSAAHPSRFAGSGDLTRSVTSEAIDTTDASLARETPTRMLNSQRQDPSPGSAMRWHFPVEPGQYEVRLYFAETDHRAQAVGARIFDVSVEKELVGDDYDIFASVGGFKGVMESFTTESDDRLDFSLHAVQGAPVLAGIEIAREASTERPSEPTPTPSPSVTATPTPEPSTSPSPSPTPPPAAVDQSRPFADSSPFNVPIPATPALAPNSAAVASHLASGDIVADLYEFGVPVFEAAATSPKYNVDCTEPWGPCGLEDDPVPIPNDARPAPGSDGHMAVIDSSTRRVYEFWQARKSSGGWSASFGTWSSLDGSGHPGSTGDARDAQVSLLAGTVRAGELQRGVIDHALVFSSDNVNHAFQYPATKSSQSSGRSDALTMGARIQLDPSVNVDAIPGITPAEKAVAKALQKYGAYVIDGGGARMAYIFETPFGEADPYPGLGFTSDYAGMPHIPWERLRVLRQWDGR